VNCQNENCSGSGDSGGGGCNSSTLS